MRLSHLDTNATLVRAVIMIVLTSPHFTYPEGMEARVKLVCSGDLNPGPPAYMNKRRSD